MAHHPRSADDRCPGHQTGPGELHLASSFVSQYEVLRDSADLYETVGHQSFVILVSVLVAEVVQGLISRARWKERWMASRLTWRFVRRAQHLVETAGVELNVPLLGAAAGIVVFPVHRFEVVAR